MDGSATYGYLAHCPRCAWSSAARATGSRYHFELKAEQRFLKRLSVNDADVTLRELGTHLKNQWTDVYSLEARRFEELIEDVFRNIGWRTLLTKQSRDGGADVVLFDAGANQAAIVEVKRYAAERTVGIGVMDRLLGAAIRWDVRKAILVTSARFTDGVWAEMQKLRERRGGIDLELWDADDVLRELNSYSADLPPLSVLDPAAVSAGKTTPAAVPLRVNGAVAEDVRGLLRSVSNPFAVPEHLRKDVQFITPQPCKLMPNWYDSVFPEYYSSA